MECHDCGDRRDKERLPPGWHRNRSGDPLCGKCWNKRYLLRAPTIPVASPIGCDWPELREALKAGYRDVARLKNWAVRKLATLDVVRTPEMKKLPKMERHYLYPEARIVAADLPASTTTSVLRAVEKTYVKHRFETIWLGNASLSNYRYPQPIPFHNQSWRAEIGDDEQAWVRLTLGGNRFVLRLRGGHNFRRQLKQHAQIASGEATRGELVLYEQSAQKTDHRPNGANGRTRLMCKMVAWLPRAEDRVKSGVLFATTSDDAMVIAVNAKNDRLWSIHANHVLRWAAEHRRRLQGWSDDRKREVNPKKPPFLVRRRAACRKYKNRMDTSVDQIAAHLVAYAKRCRFAELRWITGQPKRTVEFPWFRFDTKVQQLCDEAGIVYSQTGDVKDEN